MPRTLLAPAVALYGCALVTCALSGCGDDATPADAALADTGGPPGDAAGRDADARDGAAPDTGSGVDGSGEDAGPPALFRPAPGTSWQWQLTGAIDTSLDVVMYDIDLFETPQSVIDALHADGRVVICYFSAGSQENFRADAGDFPSEAVGRTLDGWPDERWVDVRHLGVRDVMRARLDLAVAKRCDGVEPDNVDGYANRSGFPLTAGDQLDYNRFLAAEAHARLLSVGLKNDLDQVAALVGDFDWALDEECFQYDECDLLRPFLDAGKAVFHVEYGGAGLADTICPRANALGLDTLIKNLDLDAWRVACR